MRILPEFHIGIINGWIPLFLYFIGFIISVSFYSKEARSWLFNNPKDQNKKVSLFIRLVGQFAMIGYILMMIFTPMDIQQPLFLVGAGIYTIGYLFVISALYYFRRTPIGQPVVAGPYRISRNPQWVGLFLILLGSGLASGVWLYVGIVIIVGIIYHIQILEEEKVCILQFGESYQSYMKRIPRYLLF